ncbi:unnamed protein product, partial [Clonostachys rosea]
MKFYLPALALFATGALASPAAEAVADPDPWCTRIGQPCWKNK